MTASSYTQPLALVDLTCLHVAALAAGGLVGSIDKSKPPGCKLSVKVKTHDASGPVTNKVLVIVAILEGRTDNVHNATQCSTVCGKGAYGRWTLAIRSHLKDQFFGPVQPQTRSRRW